MVYVYLFLLFISVQSQRGIQITLMISGDYLLCSTGEVDRVGIMSNLQALMSVATDLSMLNKYMCFVTCYSKFS